MELWDVNCMLGRWPSADLLFHDMPGLLARMDQLGIARAVVSYTEALHLDPVAGNALFRQVWAQAEPRWKARLWPAWVLVPPATREQGTLAELEQALEVNGIGIARLYPRDHNYSLSSPDAAELLGLLARRQALTLLDVEQSSWEEIDRLAAAYPALPLVACNVGYRGLRRFAGVLARRPNVHIDLSYFGSHQGLEWLVGQIGASQVLFGTGAPVIDGGGGVTRLLLSELSAADQAAVAAGNLQRLLAAAGLTVAVPGTQPPAPRPGGPARTELPSAHVLRGEAIDPSAWEVIDAHAHVGPWFNFYTPEPEAESLRHVMDRCGVQMAVVSGTRAISVEPLAGNAEIKALVSCHPDRFAGYLVFNPHVPGSLEEVEAGLAAPGIVGIKIHPDVQLYSATGPLYAPLFDLAVRGKVPVLTHTFADSAFSDPLDFEAVAGNWPDLVLILGHSGVSGEGHRRAMQVALKHPNVYLELCGSLTTGQWIKEMVAAVGPERVLYGSDFPVIEMRYALGRVVFAGLAEAELRLVLGGNARRVLRLPPAQAAR
ncbi:MAG: amidohydrolase family protein [Anaerolineales bacterium]|nr:amidohydrolase family protein [Anaerolineales bacterium]